ncbi:MAG: autotransporter-associated beta strand repeat-containing protein [Anaerolineae bacterium]|nr:autotransporter-associated beta strand repeat-containing protein [Phycisphaerae bacterium]
MAQKLSRIPNRLHGRRTSTILLAAASTAAGLSQLMTPGGAIGATVTWANTNVTFSAAAAWIGGVAPTSSTSADVAVFQGVPSAQPLLTGTSRSLGALDLQSSGWIFTPSVAGNRLSFGTGVDQGGGVFLSGINSTTNPTGTAQFDIGINISNTPVSFNYSLNTTFNGLFESDGAGTARTLTFLGSGNTVMNGNLNLASGASPINRTFIFNNTGTGTMLINGPIITSSGSNGTFAVDGTSLVELTNAGNTQFQTRLAGGTLRIHADGNLGATPAAFTSNNINVTGTSTLQLAAGLGTFTLGANRGISITGATSRTFTIDTNDAANTMVLSNPIVETGGGIGNFTKQGAGTLILNAANTLTGTVNFGGGTMIVANPAALGTGLLRWGGGTLASTAPLTVNNTSVLTNLSTIGGSQTITFAGQLQYNGTTDRTERFSQDAGVVTQVNGGLVISTDAPRVFAIAGTGEVAFNSPISETPGQPGTLRIASDGTATMNAANTYTGGTNIRSGRLKIGSDDNLGAAGTSISFGSSGTLLATSGTLLVTGGVIGTRDVVVFEDGGTLDADGAPFVTSGTITGPGALTKHGAGVLVAKHVRTGGLHVNAGIVGITPNGAAAGASNIGSLTIAGGPSAPTARFDLADNDAVFTATPRADVQSYINFARNGGAWNQPGLSSSSAASSVPKNKTLGVLSGAEYNALYPGGDFNGFTLTATDVAVKFTYYGDVDFNGVVDFDDYSRIDAGFNNNRTGWLNGDVDANGIVDFDDYSLIDQAFNTQSGTLRRAMSYLDGSDRSEKGMDEPSLQLVMDHLGQFGEQYAAGFLNSVPEPTSTVVMSGLAVLAAGRRRRRVR